MICVSVTDGQQILEPNYLYDLGVLCHRNKLAMRETGVETQFGVAALAETEMAVKAATIVIPAYDEASGIGQVLDDLFSVMTTSRIEHEVLVIDDGSTDRTAEVAACYPVRLLRHRKNRGYGASLKTGIRHAQHGIIVITDADGTYPSEYIPDLIEKIGEYDMVVGARLGQDAHIPLIRRPAKWFLNMLANYLVGERIPDLNSGLRAFKKDVALNLLAILPSGFSFTTAITLAMLTNDHPVLFVPIKYHKRVGSSKIRPIQDTVNFLFLILRTILLFNPLRVFVPMCLLLFALTGAKIIRDMIVFDYHVATSTVVMTMTALQVALLGLLADLIVRTRLR